MGNLCGICNTQRVVYSYLNTHVCRKNVSDIIYWQNKAKFIGSLYDKCS